MPVRIAPCYLTFDGTSGLRVIDCGPHEGSLVNEPYREQRPSVVRLPGKMLSSGSFSDPLLLRISQYLPRHSPDGHPLDDVLDQLNWVGWVDIKDMMRERALARRRKNRPRFVRLAVRRIRRMSLVPVYVFTESLPSSITDAKRLYVTDSAGTAILCRLSGDRERPAGFVRRA